MVTVVRHLFGQLITVATTDRGDAHHHAGVGEFAEVAVDGGRGHARAVHDLLDRKGAIGFLQHGEHGAPVRREAQLVGSHGLRRGCGNR